MLGWISRRIRRRTKPNYNAFNYHGGSRQIDDVVVFVHGLGGSETDTWGRFPALLHRDPHLPLIDILMWGYQSRIILGRGVKSVEVEGRRLMSDLKLMSAPGGDLFLVGHSLGGVTILAGLVNELRELRARQVPLALVRQVALYATPVNGQELAWVVSTLARVPLLGWLASAHIANLCSKFCDPLLNLVTNHISHAVIQPGEEASKRLIPIATFIGARDGVVSEHSARGVFKDSPTALLDAGHFDIKLPDSRADKRYMVLRKLLSDHYASWLHKRVALILDRTASAQQRTHGQAELAQRCDHAFDYYLGKSASLCYEQGSAPTQSQIRKAFIEVVIEMATAKPGAPLEQILTAALACFRPR